MRTLQQPGHKPRQSCFRKRTLLRSIHGQIDVAVSGRFIRSATAYLLSLDEEGFAEYMRTEREKYDRMKAKAEKQAIERAKTLGV